MPKNGAGARADCRRQFFSFSSYGARVLVDFPNHVKVADLDPHLAPQVWWEPGGEGPSDACLEILREGRYLVRFAGRSYGPFNHLATGMHAVANVIHFVIATRSPLTFVHSGAVEVDGSAVLFPGRSEWGKSTIVSELVRQGCGYLSDEYAVVSPSGTILPFSKPIRLRSANGSHHLPARGIGVPDGLPCAAVIITRYEEGTTWKPDSLSPGILTLHMLSHTLRSRDVPEQVLEALTALTRSAVGYQSARGEAASTVAPILALVGDNPRKQKVGR